MEKVWAALANELAEVSASAGRSVVGVQGTRHPSSGIVVAKDAVVAASHAVRRDDDVTVVTGPGERVSARVIGRDPGTDLVALRLQEPIDTPIARWGSTTNLRVGEFVLALARTRRGNIVASSGIISGLINAPLRTWRGGEIDQFIRPDLNLYPGFSGGPLVNSQGEFLGLNSSALHRSGITIPSATVVRVSTELLEKGRVERAYLGLAMQSVPLPESLRRQLNLMADEGLLIVHVESGSPAEKAGVLIGDILLTLAGKPVGDTDSVQQVLRASKTGAKVDAGLVRGGVLTQVTIQLEARPAR